MKKTLSMTLVALAMALSAHAIRAVHELFPVRQSDGTMIMLYKNGDGHLAFYTTPDNQVVIRNSEGTLCYAQLENGKLVATAVTVHNPEARTAEENAFVAANTLKPTDATLTELAAPERAVSRVSSGSTGDGLGKYGVTAGGRVPSVGNVTLPVIMVEFTDMKFQDDMTIEKLTRYFNQEGYNEDNSYERGSVKDYFKAQSRGMFVPTFDVVAKVQLSNGYAYYGANSGSSHNTRAMQMVKDAVSGAVSQGVNFSKYYVNSRVPNVIVYYAGCGEATGGDENTVWPHEMDLSVYNMTMSGYNFGSYFVGNELYGTSTNNRLMGMGVFVHEFSHAMGLPDFYDTKYSYENDSPFGTWSVMDTGPYTNNSYAPIGYTAYERSFMGWLNIKELKSDAESVTLTNPNDNEGQYAVMLRNPSNSNEYFILENRQPGTWYYSEHGSGLMVTRIAFNSSSWTGNSVNTTQSAKRAMIVTASGRAVSGEAQSTDLFGNGVNNKESYTLYGGSELTTMPVYRILKNPDGTLVLNFKDRTLAQTTLSDETAVYEKVSDASVLAANDEIIFVNEADKVAMASGVQSASRAAVNVSVANGRAYANESVIRFSLVKAANGAGWGFRNIDTNTYLGANSSGLKMVAKADVACIATINITDGNAAIVFNGTVARKNLGYNADDYYFSCFADAQNTLQIYRKASSNGISTVTDSNASQNGDRTFNLAGQQVGNDYKGIVIIGGKKYVRH